MTVMLTLADVIVGRLRASPSIGVDADSIRRSHRIPVDRDHAPAVHVKADGVTEATSGRGCVQRECRFVVAVVVRDDEALGAADPLVAAVIARLAHASTIGPAYPAGVLPKLGRVTPDEESADADAMRVDIEYAFTFSTVEDSIDIV